MTEVFPICPKCLAASGDDWSQCGGSCPIQMSPHFDAETYNPLIEHFHLVDAGEHERLLIERERGPPSPWPPEWLEEVPF